MTVKLGHIWRFLVLLNNLKIISDSCNFFKFLTLLCFEL
jgi:hypothetical protein